MTGGSAGNDTQPRRVGCVGWKDGEQRVRMRGGRDELAALADHGRCASYVVNAREVTGKG